MSRSKISTLIFAFFALGTRTNGSSILPRQQDPLNPGLPIPRISDNRFTTQGTVDFFYDYYTAKSQHNITSYMKFFHPTKASYVDVALGGDLANSSLLQARFTSVFAAMQPNSIAYPLQIVGDTKSAIVASVDTPGMYGAEVRLLSVFDFEDNKIVRVLDVWDGRKSSVKGNGTSDQYYDNLGLDNIKSSASEKIKQVASQLNTFLAKGDINGTQSLISYNAVLEDLTLRTKLTGKLAIGRYLQRSISKLPYGTSTTFRHAVGSGQGGGYEWKSKQDAIYRLSLIELDNENAIKRYVTLWDGSRVTDEEIKTLNALALE